MKKFNREAMKTRLLELQQDANVTPAESTVLQDALREIDTKVADDHVVLVLKQELAPMALRHELSPNMGKLYLDLAQMPVGFEHPGAGITQLFF